MTKTKQSTRRDWWRRCPHSRLRGIYGDEVIFATPKFLRLKCLDCGRYLYGPVALAEARRGEWDTSLAGERKE